MAPLVEEGDPAAGLSAHVTLVLLVPLTSAVSAALECVGRAAERDIVARLKCSKLKIHEGHRPVRKTDQFQT